MLSSSYTMDHAFISLAQHSVMWTACVSIVYIIFPVHPTGFAFYIFSGSFTIFILSLSNNIVDIPYMSWTLKEKLISAFDHIKFRLLVNNRLILFRFIVRHKFSLDYDYFILYGTELLELIFVQSWYRWIKKMITVLHNLA